MLVDANILLYSVDEDSPFPEVAWHDPVVPSSDVTGPDDH